MNSKPDDRRVRKTKRALREGLAILMEEKNIKDITVRELTDLVDMHRGTFYLHYRDIYDLQEHIENELMAEVTHIFLEFKPMSHEESPLPMFKAFLEYVTENARMCSALLGSNANHSFIDKLSAALEEKCIHSWAREYHVDADRQEMEYFSRYLVSGYIAMVKKWTEDGMTESPAQLAELMSRIGIHGIGFVDSQSPPSSHASPG